MKYFMASSEQVNNQIRVNNNGGHLEFNRKDADWRIFKVRPEQYFITNKIGSAIVKRALWLNLRDKEAY